MKRQILLGVLILLAVGGFATAGPITVDDDGPADFNNIQAAIDAAVDGNVIEVAEGIYTGSGNYNLDFSNGLPLGQTRAITVRSTDPNDPNVVAATIIDCGGMGRAFDFNDFEDNNSVVEGFTIQNGSAEFGGGIECYFSEPKISKCVIRGNSADYDGGGIDCYYARPLIVDCVITDNTAGYNGAGVGCWEAAPEIINCLIQGNTAGGYGGAIDCSSSDPNITNCTIAYNSGVSGDSGGVYADGLSSPTITNCVIWGNGDDLAGCTATYSCIEDGDGGTGNRSDDPLFKMGPLGDYYLSQKAAGQLADSNCVDAGIGLASDLVLLAPGSHTTRTDSIADAGTVDMGYHYPDSGPYVNYLLITGVDVNDPNVTGIIEPNHLSPGSPYRQFAEVLLIATPNDVDCFKVNKWTVDGNPVLDPNDPFSYYDANTYILTMDSNKEVTVEFERRKEYFLATYVVGGVGGIIDPNGWYCDGVDVNVIATPAFGYAVFGWTVDGSPVPLPAEPNVLKVTMDTDANRTVTVEFVTAFVHLDFDIIPDAWGNDNGTIIPPRGGNYLLGEDVNLMAIPDLHYEVKEWTVDGNPIPLPQPDPNIYTVTMDSHKSVTVEFMPIPTRFLTTSVADGNGMVAPTAPPPVDYNAVSGIYTYYIGTTVTITASPDPGWHVEEWNGTDDDSSTAKTNTVVMDSNRAVTVAFAPGFAIGEIWICDPTTGVPYAGPYSAIQDAIDDAFGGFPGFPGDLEATPVPLPEIPAIPGDLIIVADGNYTGPRNRNLDFRDAMSYLALDWEGKHITLRSENGPEKCIIDCQGLGQGFYLHSTEDNNSVIEGFTIKNGSAEFGGGLNCEGISAPVIRNCIITDCKTGITSGGGVYFEGLADDDTTYSDYADAAEAEAAAAEDGLITDPEDPNYDQGAIIEAMAFRIIAIMVGDIVDSIGTEDAPVPTIRSCKILNNETTGSPENNGGGIFCTTNATPTIISTEISGNSAYNGGGLYSEEGGTVPAIINCLITDNTSVDIGGSIYLYESPAIINLCTIVYNSGYSYETNPLGFPINIGGIACREADPVITNCIIGRNGYTDRNLGTWGDGQYYGDDLYECSATYSCIENPDDGDGEGNTDQDPLFREGGLGDFYLSQIQAGQGIDSNCIDSGEQYILSDLQQPPPDGYSLSYDITTSIWNQPTNQWDIGYTDMGYHYPFYYGPPVRYDLTVSATGPGVVDCYYYPYDISTIGIGYDIWHLISMSIHVGSVAEATPPLDVNFTPGTLIFLVANATNPDTHRGTWHGTDEDTSTNIWNYLFMYDHKNVTVDFDPIMHTKLFVPQDFPLLQDAINAAKYKDEIVLAPAGAADPYYTSQGFFVRNKAITIRSAEPNDPAIVAATVIELQIGPEGYIDITCFRFDSVGPDTILNGITIRNFNTLGYDGIDGDPAQNFWDGVPGESIYGAAIQCGGPMWLPGLRGFSGSYGQSASPTIKNCIIRDCNAVGGDGGDGAGPSEPHMPDGGHGGWPGRGYGGGISCLNNSNPTVINCTFDNCNALGGDGGNGAQGNTDSANYGKGGRGGGWYYTSPPLTPYEWADGERLHNPNPGEWDFYTEYSGRGGAVYVGTGCSPTFTDCTFTNNRTEGGLCGICGQDGWPPEDRERPSLHWKIDNFGGAVFCDADSSAVFTNCTFGDNLADPNRPVFDPNGPADDPYNCDNDDLVVGFGGAVAFKDKAHVTFENCTFSDNSGDEGGAMYWSWSDPVINECNFVDNLAQSGGALLFAGGFGQISRCNFSDNEAIGASARGGGICSLGANVLISDCNISKNEADSSGGGVYISSRDVNGGDLVVDGNTVFGWNKSVLLNCLIAQNIAGEDGGGVSARWDSEPEIINCTIADNIVTGVGYGGGVYGSYGSYTNIIDSIVWGNSADFGPQIGIGITVSPSTVEVSDSDVQGAQSDAYVEDDCSLIWDPNNLYTDPLFVIGPLGDYYLSQTEVGDPNQTVDSPCVDAGSGSAIGAGMSGYTTRTDELFDRGIVDMGYHHLITLEVEECRVVDLFLDHFINFKDFAVFAWNWLRDDCSDDNGWCDGADLTFDENVDWEDLEFYIGCWLVVDNDTPAPNPSEWAIEPYSSSPTSIGMVAETTIDTWGGDVEYYFECVYGDCSDSGWQSEPSYTDSGLVVDTEYGYRVRAKDSRCGDISDLNCTFDLNDPNDPNAPNKTDWSDIRYAITSERECYAVICGISNTIPYLPFSVNDAVKVYERLVHSANWNPEADSSPGNIVLLTDSSATKAAIHAEIQNMATKLGGGDLFLFYFSDHGTTGEDVDPIDEADGLDEYLVPYGGVNDLSNCIRDDELGDWLAELPTDNYIVLLDACFSGGHAKDGLAPMGLGDNVPAEGDGFAEDLLRITGRVTESGGIQTLDLQDNSVGVVLTATDEGELGWQALELEHGVFTYYLLEAMDGIADQQGNDNGWVSGEECYDYLAPKVNTYVQGFGEEQHPQLYDADLVNELEFLFLELVSPGTPAAPAVLGAWAVSSSQIDLAWLDDADNEDGFEIERRTDGDPFLQIDTVGPGTGTDWIEYSDTGLVELTTYTYRVRAYNAAGYSPFSNEAYATTFAEGQEPNDPNDPNEPSDPNEPNEPSLQAPVIVSANQVEVGSYWHHIITAQATAEDPLYFRFVCLNESIFNSAWVPRDGPAVETFAHPVLPGVLPDATITRGSGVITYDIAVGVSWNLWQWRVCGSNGPSGVPSLCSAPVAMPPPF